MSVIVDTLGVVNDSGLEMCERCGDIDEHADVTEILTE
jgi:hypothetical protein